MGSCVLGFDASGISSAALETEIKRVVQVIEQYPDTGERVYKKVYEEFQVFLKQHLAKRPVTQKLMGVAEQLEQKEILTIQSVSYTHLDVYKRQGHDSVEGCGRQRGHAAHRVCRAASGR